MMDVEKDKENCLTGTQDWGILVYFLLAGSMCLGFYLVEIMVNNQDHKLSSASALYLAVVRFILAIFSSRLL